MEAGPKKKQGTRIHDGAKKPKVKQARAGRKGSLKANSVRAKGGKLEKQTLTLMIQTFCYRISSFLNTLSDRAILDQNQSM